MTDCEPCPLCAATATTLLHKGGKGSGYRDFLHCGECDMVFVPRAQIIDSASQKARYLQHNNEVDDPRIPRVPRQDVLCAAPALEPRRLRT